MAAAAGDCIVTGAAGFIGSHLSAALIARGRRVIGVDNFDPFYARSLKRANLGRLDPAHFELAEGDIRDSAALAALFARVRPDCVFHIAALAGVRPSIADPARYVSVNVDGLTSVLDAARAAGCRRVVFASSSSVYGNGAKVPFSETVPADAPISPYAATKRAGELLCQTYAHLFGLRIAALRFFTVFGPAQRPDLAISSFMRLIADGREVPMFGDGSMSRDYTYIDDIIAGVLAAHDAILGDDPPAEGRTDNGGFFRIWNLGGAHPIELHALIDEIGRVVGRAPRIQPMPMQPGDVQRTFAELTRSAAELGYRPHVPLAEGLRRQWNWTQAQRQTTAAAAAR